jgi:hypothetical protein
MNTGWRMLRHDPRGFEYIFCGAQGLTRLSDCGKSTGFQAVHRTTLQDVQSRQLSRYSRDRLTCKSGFDVLNHVKITRTKQRLGFTKHKENTVRVGNWFVTAVFLFAGCTSTPPEKAIINDAAIALGGADKIQAVNTLTILGSRENLNLGQNLSPDAQEPILKVSEYKRSIDFAGTRSRLEQVRTATVGNTAPVKQILCLDGDAAFNVNAAGMATRASDQVAKDRRAETYHHPIGALRAALAQGAVVANPRKEGNADVVDITTADGAKLTLEISNRTVN